MSILFILGSGTSVDSGLPTYRGPNGIYTGTSENPQDILRKETLQTDPHKIWKILKDLHISNPKPGPTYDRLRDVISSHPNSFVITQNVDGFARTLNCGYAEIHGSALTMTCMDCVKRRPTDIENQRCECGGLCRPDIILFGEDLPMAELAKMYGALSRNYEYVAVIGTTLAFPYLHQIVEDMRRKGSKIIHINPDITYSLNVKQGDVWIRDNALEGLNYAFPRLTAAGIVDNLFKYIPFRK